eukprot:1892269-Lingulodinium_polyedra.AAC.1
MHLISGMLFCWKVLALAFKSLLVLSIARGMPRHFAATCPGASPAHPSSMRKGRYKPWAKRWSQATAMASRTGRAHQAAE